jgi:hypothetical protein
MAQSISSSPVPTRTRSPVPRPELEARLLAGVEYKLTLISAPLTCAFPMPRPAGCSMEMWV